MKLAKVNKIMTDMLTVGAFPTVKYYVGRSISGSRHIPDVVEESILNYTGVERDRVVGVAKVANWIIPSFKMASGGHNTIFRAAQVLSKFGYRHNFYIFPPFDYPSEEQVRELINRYYFKDNNFKIHYLTKFPPELVESNILFVTDWRSAYIGSYVKNAAQKIYFVQDFEPYFYPKGATSALAEQTYKFGYKLLAASPWLHQLLTKEYDMKGSYFDLAVDHKNYYRSKSFDDRENSICFYSRLSTERRATYLGIQALKLLKKQRPDVQIYVFGDSGTHFGSEFVHLGILNTRKLQDLYSRCKLGVVFSLTNYSLIPQEMNACGLPVLEVKWKGNEVNYAKRRGVVLVEPQFQQLSNKMAELLDSDNALAEISRQGVLDVRDLNWEDELTKAFVQLDLT